jgi:hypothetical protein
MPIPSTRGKSRACTRGRSPSASRRSRGSSSRTRSGRGSDATRVRQAWARLTSVRIWKPCRSTARISPVHGGPRGAGPPETVGCSRISSTGSRPGPRRAPRESPSRRALERGRSARGREGSVHRAASSGLAPAVGITGMSTPISARMFCAVRVSIPSRVRGNSTADSKGRSCSSIASESAVRSPHRGRPDGPGSRTPGAREVARSGRRAPRAIVGSSCAACPRARSARISGVGGPLTERVEHVRPDLPSMSVATQSSLIPVSSSALCSPVGLALALLDLRLAIPRQLSERPDRPAGAGLLYGGTPLGASRYMSRRVEIVKRHIASVRTGPRTEPGPETEGFPDGRVRISEVPCTQAPSGHSASVNVSGNQRPGRAWRPRLLGRSRAWRGVFLPSTAGPGPTGPGVPGRRTVDSTALVITLLIVLLVVIDRVVRR